jgi:hypothetical protein
VPEFHPTSSARLVYRLSVVLAAGVLAAATACTRGTATPMAAPSSAHASGVRAASTANPRVPAPSASDLWRGGKPIAGVTPQAVVSGLTQRWHLSFGPQHAGIGVTSNVGWAGDQKRKNRELLAIVESDQSGALRNVYCSGGGLNVAVSADTTLRTFIYDCVARAAGETAWAQLKPWLDQNYLLWGKRADHQAAGLSIDVESNNQWVRIHLTGL